MVTSLSIGDKGLFRRVPKRFGGNHGHRSGEISQDTTFAFTEGARVVRLAVNVHCPRCGTDDVGADRRGAVVLCGARDYNPMADRRET